MKTQNLVAMLLLATTLASIPVALTVPPTRGSTTIHFDLYQNNNTKGVPCSGQTNCFNTTSPGPTMTVNQGDTVQITVHNNDSITHTFTISTYVADSSINPQTSKSITPFVASTSGTFKYECTIHPNDMFGNLVVKQVSSSPITPTSILGLLGTTALAAFITMRKRR